jgi:hypothetical protein
MTVLKVIRRPGLRGCWVTSWTVTRHGEMCSRTYCQRLAQPSIAQTIAFCDSRSEQTQTARFNRQGTGRCSIFANCVVIWRWRAAWIVVRRCHTVTLIRHFYFNFHPSPPSPTPPHPPPCSNHFITPFASEELGVYVLTSAEFRKMETW